MASQAAGFVPTNYAQFLINQDVRTHLFPQLDYKSAASLMMELNAPFRRSDYVSCRMHCESPAPVNYPVAAPPAPPMPPANLGNPVNYQMQPYVLRAERIHNSALPNNAPACNNRPVFHNLAYAFRSNTYRLGRREPSFCALPHNSPMPGMHPYPDQRGLVLVCQDCKDRRGEDWIWKMNHLKFGVCKTCRKWALENLDEFENQCTCGPVGDHIANWNGNGIKGLHMCFNHFQAYWTLDTEINANIEINRRFWLVRTRAPKKRGHGWTKKKAARPPVRTPTERRQATRVAPPVPFQPVHLAPPGHPPRCFCGNPLTEADHSWIGPLMTQDADQVRNCVGCDRFWRTRE